MFRERRKNERRVLPVLPPEARTNLRQGFSDAQGDALEKVWGLNALTLQEIRNIVIFQGKLLRRGLLSLFVLFLTVGYVGLRVQVDANDAARKAAAAAHKAADATLAAQTGRHVSLGVTCATLSAVAQAGRAIISGPIKSPPIPQERALRALGFPPFKARRAAAVHNARQYVHSISVAVDSQVGRVGDGLVKADGTIDCARLANLAQIGGRSPRLSSGAKGGIRKH